MPSSLLTGISGLVAHQRRLDVVANNLANLNTVAFKSQRTVFSDLLYETVGPATNGNDSNTGGSNPSQVGSGVRTAQISKKMSQGTLEVTGQAYDFAIQGEGFFTLNDGSKNVYSRAGAFSLDDEGYLVDPSTGYFVQRFGQLGEGDDQYTRFQVPGDSRIQVPIGATIAGNTSSELDITGNLLGDASNPTTEKLTSLSPFLASGSPATATTLLNDLDINTTGYAATGDSIEITGANADGTAIDVTLSVDDTTTLGDIVDAINTANTDSVASIDASGNLVVVANAAGDAALSLSLEDSNGNTGLTEYSVTNPFVSVHGKPGESIGNSLQIYDAQAGAHTLSYTITKRGDKIWDLEFSLDASEGSVIDGSITSLTFDDTGGFNSAGDPGEGDAKIELSFNGITRSQTINVDLNALTQYATAFDLSNAQDGRASGKLAGISIGHDGAVEGVSTNGDKVPIAQVAITHFRNPSGLISEGSNYYSESLNSGTGQPGIGGLGGRGRMLGGQLEQSNVDMALEFTQLIIAQRGFSANARTITVSNEMLQELTNVIR